MSDKRVTGRKTAIETQQINWVDLGDLSSAQAAIGVTARAYATVLALTSTGIVHWNVPMSYNCIEVRFSTDAEDDAQVIDVLVSSGSDQFVRAATLTLTGGTQTAPAGARAAAGVYCDTMVLSNNAWHGEMEVVQSGTDYIARFTMDLLGYDHVVFHATTLAANTTITIEGRGF